MAKQKQEMEDIKQFFNFMSGELTTVTKPLKVLMDLMGKIKVELEITCARDGGTCELAWHTKGIFTCSIC